jgi:hypothetical protein
MREWSLAAGDPLYLTLAADARLCTPDYVDDHIWELELGSGEPRAVSLRTTYGLRARSMRLFLRFTEDGRSLSDPAEFQAAPTLRRFFPNFLELEFAPFADLSVRTEYWIPESHAAAGRVTLTNHGAAVRQMRLELAGSLAPLDGQSLTPVQQQLVNVLAGQTGGLFPVVFLTGGPRPGPGPYASLLLDVELGAGATRQFVFAQAARDTLQASFEMARHTAARPWDAERARIELLDISQTVDIETGDPHWDAALAFSQRAGLALFFGGNQHLPEPSYVLARQPDHGFSRKGDGTDYPAPWNGQTPLESYYLASLLPGAPQLGRSLIQNFLSTQVEAGAIDHKPGLAGQRGKLLAAPLLAALAWRVYQACPDEVWLAQVYPALQAFFEAWLDAEHDPDRDGLPQWDHLLQTGFEDNPLFDVWHPWSQGVDISSVKSPALAAMLYAEAGALARMAAHLGRPEAPAELGARAEVFKAALDAAWNQPAGLYSYRDRESGLSLPGKVLIQGQGAGSLRPKAEFRQPVRLQIEILTQASTARRPEVELGEYVTKGETETLTGDQFQWRSGGLVATSQRLYKRVGRVKVRGVGADDTVVVRTVDLTAADHTLFLPLWAGVPETRRAKTMVNKTLLNPERFDLPFGIPAFPGQPEAEAEMVALSVHLPWNQMIGEGLVAYGLRAEAARLTARLMNAVVHSLKQTRSFYQRYHAQSGTGIGERNALNGFAPVGLFLRTLGLTIYSPRRLRLEGENPFPWPVTVRYRGLTVMRGARETLVTFPSGAQTRVTRREAVVVSET